MCSRSGALIALALLCLSSSSVWSQQHAGVVVVVEEEEDEEDSCLSAAANAVNDTCRQHNSSLSVKSSNHKNNNKKEQWKWLPQAEHHPCNIVCMSFDDFLERFGARGLPPLYHEPIVVRKDPRNDEFIQRTSPQRIVDFFPPNFHVTLSSSNSFSAHRRTIPLQQYLHEISSQAAETTPDQLSNETWYLFGETYTEPWQDLLKHYKLPPCHTCRADLVALSFGIGNRGSGVQWHAHGPGFSQALHGRKHWVLYPMDKKPHYDPDRTSRHWMEYTYTALSLEDHEMPWECTLDPGDFIYFPNEWHHATINLDPYTAFVSTFTMEHNVVEEHLV